MKALTAEPLAHVAGDTRRESVQPIPAVTEVQDRDPRAWYLRASPLATIPWLIRLRWSTAAIQLAAGVATLAFSHLDLPLRRLAPLILLAALVNAGVALRLARAGSLPRWAAGLVLGLESVLLTGLLELTGGPLNPFCVLYGVQVALAGLTLGASWAWFIGGIGGLSYALLVVWHLQESVSGHHRLNDFPTHLFTMWVAVALTADLVAYFVSQASEAIARRERELEEMRSRAARDERLASLTTLAAGAAHELSTPLATIAIAARELERTASVNGSPALGDDVRLIRTQVNRCQTILDQMSGRAGGATADRTERIDLEAILNDVRERLTGDQQDRLRIQLPGELAPVFLPRAGLTQVLASLLKNAFEASPAGSPVVLTVSQDGDALRFTVEDAGPGMPAEILAHAGEPFYTTKDPGNGLGLGLFLARAFAERFGGRLTLRSEAGTTAILDLKSAAGAPPSERP